MKCPLCGSEDLYEKEIGLDDDYMEGDYLYVVYRALGACRNCGRDFNYMQKYKMVLVEETLLGKYGRSIKYDTDS